jgi:hypothetical protein
MVGWGRGALPARLTTKRVFEKLRGNVKVEKHLHYLIIGEKEDHKVAIQMSLKTKKPNGDIKTGITITQVKPWLGGVGEPTPSLGVQGGNANVI